MRTPDTPAAKMLKAERRALASLRLRFGGLDDRWTTRMIAGTEDLVCKLEWQVQEERRARRRATQKRADDKRRGKV